MKRIVWFALAAAVALGCAQQKAPQQAQQQTPTEPVMALVAYDGIGIRKQPSEDKALKGNVFTSVDRGEKVEVLGDTTGWTKVRLSDDKEGWIKTSLIRTGVEKLAVMTDEVQVFARPDPSSRGTALDSASGKLGSIVWIYKDKDGFYECEFPGNRKGWIKVGALSEDATELEAARLLEQARKYMARKQGDLADKYYKQIVDGYPSTKVAQIASLEGAYQPASPGQEQGD